MKEYTDDIGAYTVLDWHEKTLGGIKFHFYLLQILEENVTKSGTLQFGIRLIPEKQEAALIANVVQDAEPSQGYAVVCKGLTKPEGWQIEPYRWRRCYTLEEARKEYENLLAVNTIDKLLNSKQA